MVLALTAGCWFFVHVVTMGRMRGALLTNTWLARAAALALTSIASSIHAAEARFELAWVAPAECPDQDAIERRLEELLGAPAGALVTRDVRVQAVVVARGEQYELRLRSEVADAQPGSRELAAENCEELSAAGAVIIALLVNPEALSAQASGPSGPASSGTAPMPSAEPPPAAPAVASEPTGTGVPRASTRAPPVPTNANPSPVATAPAYDEADTLVAPALLLGTAAIADVGALPSVAPGVQALLGAKWSRVRVEANASFLPGRFASAEDNPNKGGSISLWAGAVQGCYALLADEVSFGPCAGVAMGSHRGRGRGLRKADDDQVPWLAATAGLQLSVPLQRSVSVRLQGLLAAPLVRPRFYYLREDGETEQLHRPAPVTGRLAVALDIAF